VKYSPFTFAKQIFHSEAISLGEAKFHSPQANFVEKSTSAEQMCFFLARVDKKDASYIYAFSVLFKSANSNIQQNQSSFFSSLHPNHRGMQESLWAVQYDRGHRNYPQNDDLG